MHRLIDTLAILHIKSKTQRFLCSRRLVLMAVMAHGTQDVLRDLVAKLRKDFAALSMDKFAHGLVMALMVKDREECLPQIVNDIIQSPNLKRVRLHPYGQLVVQHAEKYLVVPLTIFIFYFFFYNLASLKQTKFEVNHSVFLSCREPFTRL